MKGINIKTHFFTSIILDSENYQETLNQSEATNALIISSRKEFTFTNYLDDDQRTILNRGIAKLYNEYINYVPFYVDYTGGIRDLLQGETHYLVYVKPVKYNKYFIHYS